MTSSDIRLKGHLQYKQYVKGRFELPDQRDRRVSLEFFRGDTIGPIEVQVFDRRDVPVDITPYGMILTVKRYTWDTEILYQVDSAVGEDAPYLYQYNPAMGVLHWVIPPSVSELFPPCQYWYDIQLYIPEDQEADPPTVLFRRSVIRDMFIIKQDITTDGVTPGS